MGIVRNCDGLPLAIKVVGGLLRTKRVNKCEWTSVLENPAWSREKIHDELNSAVRLSYEDLSPPLKQCFLYYSVIPKGVISQLPYDIIIGMWMSQGFIQVPAGDEQRSKEEIGICYYWDLIRRNLIEPQLDKVLDGSFSRMHDVIRSFAQHMSKEEALVLSSQICSHALSTKFRRLSIESTESESGLESMVLPEWSSISQKQELLRSLIIHGKMKFEPTDSCLGMFPSLRALYVSQAEFDRFVESLSKLRHLRFLFLHNTDISKLPDDIDKLKFLEFIHLCDCDNLNSQIPRSILTLEHLRYLCIIGTQFDVPKGFGQLINLRTLGLFPVQIDGDWCSLQELGPLSQLRQLGIGGLEKVPSGSFAAKAKIDDKQRLSLLSLWCSKCNLGEVTEEDCQRVEEAFDQLCPPSNLEQLSIFDYLGRRAPSWMCMTQDASVDFNSLRGLDMDGLPFCTQLPDGLCKLPNLEGILINSAPAIERVGPEFQQTGGSSRSQVRSSFPRLQRLQLNKLRQWEEWEWEEEAEATIAMPNLHTLRIGFCKLGCLPAGLASSRRLALKKLELWNLTRITALENFPSVVELEVSQCPSLKTIRGFGKLQTVRIEFCPALEVLEAGPALHTMVLQDPGIETLPEYLRGLKPQVLRLLDCHQKLRSLLSGSDETSADYMAEMEKVKHCGKLVVL